MSAMFKSKGLTWFRERVKNIEDSEPEQIIIRLVIGLCLVLYFSIPWTDAGIVSPLAKPMLWFYSGAMVLTAALLIEPVSSPIRRIAGILLDIITLSSAMMMAGSESIYFFGIYLWVILGNGFRFGVNYLYISLAIGLFGFVTATEFGEYWQTSENIAIAHSLLFLLALIPLYAAFLIKKLHAATETAKQANEAKSRFLANMSHELRTPLNGVIGLGDLLRETDLNSEQSDLANTMHKSAHTLLGLIEKVLDISKIEAGKIEITKKRLDLHALVNSVLELQRPIGNTKGLTVSCTIDSNVPFLLEGDQPHIRQVLINLVGNAIKFTQQGSVNLHLYSLSNDEATTKLRFEIKDTGIGIDTDVIDSVFDDFTQVGQTKEGGTGLGTTISKELVELMGGEIGVVSKRYKGSTFWFELPFNIIPYDSLDISDNKLLVMSGEQTAAELKPMLESWKIKFDEVNSPVNALKLLSQAIEQGDGHKVVLVERQCLADFTPKQFSEMLKVEQLLNNISWVLLNNRGDNLLEEDIGEHYISVITDILDKRLLFNAIHAAQSIHSNAENVVSLSEHYARQIGAKPLTILVAEDNLVNQKVIDGILRRAGHSVILTDDGEKALDILEADIEKIDLLIVDKNMPGRSGDEVVLAMQYMSAEQQIPTIMLTADATPEARQASLDAGVDEFLTKPLDSKELLVKIAKLSTSSKGKEVGQQKVARLPVNITGEEKRAVEGEWFDENIFQSLIMLDTDPAFIAKLIKGFIFDGEKQIARIDNAIDDDYLQIRESLHALKGSAAELGATKLVDICRQGESYKPYDIGTEKMLQLSEDIKMIYNNTVTALNKAVAKAVTVDLAGNNTAG
ncbi:MAG: hybrid sensor histidine kinase/response regulator [Methylophaga sp.]|nr:MAG: hybrid sensor histidine kinase/response regulator [Methylophaga sp.]